MNELTQEQLEYYSGLIDVAASQPNWSADQMIGVPFHKLVALLHHAKALQSSYDECYEGCIEETLRANAAEAKLDAVRELYCVSKMVKGADGKFHRTVTFKADELEAALKGENK